VRTRLLVRTESTIPADRSDFFVASAGPSLFSELNPVLSHLTDTRHHGANCTYRKHANLGFSKIAKPHASRRLPTAPQSPRVRRLAAGFWGHGRGCARRGSDGTERGFANSENGARRGYEAGGHGLTEKSAGAPLATRRRRRRPLLAAAAAHAAARCRSGRVAEPLK
jgi:hypothetical protein